MTLALNKVVGEALGGLESGGALPIHAVHTWKYAWWGSKNDPKTDHLRLQLDSTGVHAVPMMMKSTTKRTDGTW